MPCLHRWRHQSLHRRLCLAIAVAAVARRWLERRITSTRAAGVSLLLVGTLTGSFLVFGLIVPGTGSAIAISGHDVFSLNLLSPFIPSPFKSIALPTVRLATPGQYEGYNYLGLGLIALLVLDLILRPRGIAQVCRLTPATLPLLVLSVLCMSVAVSPRITFGPWTIATIELPNVLKALMAAIHCPGRLFWPVHYLAILLVIVVTYRQWRSPTRELLLVGALILQLADLLPVRERVRTGYDRDPRHPLTAPVWRELRANHEQLIVLPPWQCTPGTPGGPEGFRIFGELAVAERLRTNSYYAARYSREQVRVHCHTPPRPERISIPEPRTS